MNDIFENLIKTAQSVIEQNIELEDLIESTHSEINLKTEYPYLIFKSSDFIRAINLSAKIVQSKSNVMMYSSISIVPSVIDKSVCFYATNDISHFRFKSELLGDCSEMLNQIIAIPITVLQKIVKLMGSKVLIYKKDERLYIRLLDGDLLLDLYKVDFEGLKFPGEVKNLITELEINNFGSIITSMLPLLNSDIRGESRRIYFTGKKAYYKSNFYYIEASIETPRMSLNFRDAEFIFKLFKYYKDKKIKIYNIESKIPRFLLALDNIEYEFINSTDSISDILIEQMNELIVPPDARVSFDRLDKIVTLSTNLPNTKGEISLQIIDKILHMNLLSNSGNSDFTFSTKILNDNVIEHQAIINSDLFKTLLNCFIRLYGYRYINNRLCNNINK